MSSRDCRGKLADLSLCISTCTGLIDFHQYTFIPDWYLLQAVNKIQKSEYWHANVIAISNEIYIMPGKVPRLLNKILLRIRPTKVRYLKKKKILMQIGTLFKYSPPGFYINSNEDTGCRGQTLIQKKKKTCSLFKYAWKNDQVSKLTIQSWYIRILKVVSESRLCYVWSRRCLSLITNMPSRLPVCCSIGSNSTKPALYR